MARKKIEQVEELAPEIEEIIGEAVEEISEDLAETLEEVKGDVEVEGLLAEEIAEEPEVVVPEEPAKKKVQVITLRVSKAIADLQFPMGFSKLWNEDTLVSKRVEAGTKLDVVIPEGCNLKKWVNYYKSLEVLGVRVIKFGVE